MDAAQPPGAPEPGPAPANADTPNGPGTLPGGAPREAANDGVLDSARTLWRDLTAQASDHLELALLETQRAGKSAVSMLIYAVAAALLLVTAWLGLLAAIVIGLAELGLHAGFGALIVVALNMVGAFVLYRMIRSASANLGFPATRRSFRAHDRGEPGPAKPAPGSASASPAVKPRGAVAPDDATERTSDAEARR